MLLLAVSFLFQPSSPPEREPARAAPDREARTPVEGAERAAPREEMPPAPMTQPEARHRNVAASGPEALGEGARAQIENDAVKVRVNSRGVRVESVVLKEFSDTKEEGSSLVELITWPERGALFAFLGDGALRELETEEYRLVESAERRLVYRAERDGVAVTRVVELDEAGYGGRLRLRVENGGERPIDSQTHLVFYAREPEAGAPSRFLNYSVLAQSEDDVERRGVSGIGSPGFFSRLFGSGRPTSESYASPVEFGGSDSQYFLLAATVEDAQNVSATSEPLGGSRGRLALSHPRVELPPGTGLERNYRLYFGPKIVERVHEVDVRLDAALNVGWDWIRPLVDLFAGMLKWTHGHVVANYGVAIILLTIVLRIAVFPLTQRSMKSMRGFSKLAPELKALQEKYGDDRAKQQEEMMKLYREKGINPLTAMGGGCIPILIQMPFMISLYFALQSTIELRHAPFVLWIDDLSAPEDLFSLGPIPIRILPLLMGASMLLQQRLTPSPSADPQQRQMMTMMSLMFIVLFYAFPSGLVLYWLVSNLLGIAQQALVNRGAEPASAG